MHKIIVALATLLAICILPAPAQAHDWRQRHSGNVLRVTFDGDGPHEMVLRDYAGDGALMMVRVDEGEGGKHTVWARYNGDTRRLEVPGNAYRLRVGESNLFTGRRTWASEWRYV